MGLEPALCVNVHDDFGVLCLGNNSTFCSTCKHSSNCKHIRQLMNVVENSHVELPPQITLFATCTRDKPSTQQSRAHKYAKVSERKIPFSLSSGMKQCLKADYSKRFNVQHDIAYLHPPLPSTSICPKCAIPNSWSVELTLVKKAFLVTPQCCYPAEGRVCCNNHTLINVYSLVSMRTCATTGCNTNLLYDGQDDCVLNMDMFIITYEVLQSHMFHFLHGR